MNEVIDVESYKIATQSIVHDNIDVVLHSNSLFRLDAFLYTVGVTFFIHSRFYCISVICRPSCAMD